MQQVIYADVLFLIDLSMDFLALYIVSNMLKLDAGMYSLAFAAALGSVYSVISVINRKDSIILAMVVAIIMILTAFGRCSLSRLAVRVTVFLVVNFILGGAMTAIFNVFNSFGSDQKVIIYGDISEVEKKMPFSVFVVGFLITAVTAAVFIRIFIPNVKRSVTEAEISYGGNSVKFDLICDSGNLLTEPLSGDPVIFLTEKAMKKLTGESVLRSLINADPDFLSKNLRCARMILYETVGGRRSGVCIRADRVRVDGKNCRAWICVSPEGGEGCRDGILPASLLT